MNNSFDYIVIGLGGLGSATAYWLSRETNATVSTCNDCDFIVEL